MILLGLTPVPYTTNQLLLPFDYDLLYLSKFVLFIFVLSFVYILIDKKNAGAYLIHVA